MAKRSNSAVASTVSAKSSLLASADPILNSVDREIAWLIEYEGRIVGRNGKPKRQKLDWTYLATVASEATAKHIRKHISKPQFQNMATILLIQNPKRKAFRELRDRIQNHVTLMNSSPSMSTSAEATATASGIGKRSSTIMHHHHRPPTTNAKTTTTASAPSYRMNGAVSSAKANNALHQRWASASRSTFRGFFAGDQCSTSHLRLPTHEEQPPTAEDQLDTATTAATTNNANDDHLRVVLNRKRSRKNKTPEWLFEDPKAAINLSVRVGTVGVYQKLQAENPIAAPSSPKSPASTDSPSPQRRRRQRTLLCPTLKELAELWFQSERGSKTGHVNWLDVKDCASSELRAILGEAMETPHFSTNPLEVLVDVKERRRFQAYQAQLESTTTTTSAARKRSASYEAKDMTAVYTVHSRKQYHSPGDVVQFRWSDKKKDDEGAQEEEEVWVTGVVQSFQVVPSADGELEIRKYDIKRSEADSSNEATVNSVSELVVYADEDASILQRDDPFKGVRVMVDATSDDLYLQRRGWYETDLTGDRVFCSLSHAMRERDDALFRKCRCNERSVMLDEMNLPEDWHAQEAPKPPPPDEYDDSSVPHAATSTADSVCSASEGTTTKCEESTSTIVSSTVYNKRGGPRRQWTPELLGPLLSSKKEKLLTSSMKELAYLLELSKESNGITSWSYVMRAAKSAELDALFKAGKRSPFWQTQKIKALIGDDRTMRDAFRLYRDKVQEKVHDLLEEEENDDVEDDDDMSLDQHSTNRVPSTPVAPIRKCPPWTPRMYKNMGVPPKMEQVLTKEEKELAYLLEIGRGRSGKFLWDWVLQQDMSPALTKLIDVASTADNQYWERQKLKSLIGCGKVKNEAMKLYREGLKLRLQELEAKGVFKDKKGKSIPSSPRPPTTKSSTMSSPNTGLMQELAFHYGQSKYHFGRVSHSYVLAHASPSLLKYYISTSHPSIDNKWNLAPNKSNANAFDRLCKESLKSAENGSPSSPAYVTSQRNDQKLQICSLLFDEVVGDEDVVKPEHLPAVHVELAFLMEKSAMLNNNCVQWAYVEAHCKSAGLTDLWTTKAQLQSFFTNRLQYLVGRNERRLETFRIARSKLKKMMLQTKGTRGGKSRSGSKRKATPQVLSSPSTSSYRPTLSPSPLSSSPKRQRKFMRETARQYMDSLVSSSRSGVVAKAKFANDLLALVRSHHTIKNGKRAQQRTSLAQLFKRQEAKLRALESDFADAVMEHVDEEEDPELEFEATTYLNFRKSQFKAFGDELVQTWNTYEENEDEANEEQLFVELEATQRTLWDYHLRAEESSLELHTVKISGLK